MRVRGKEMTGIEKKTEWRNYILKMGGKREGKTGR